MKRKKAGATRPTPQLSLDFSKSGNNMPKSSRVLETRASAEVVGLAQFRSAKIRELLIADLLKSRVAKSK